MNSGHRPAYFEELVESAPDAIAVVNQQGAIGLMNRRAEALFGYARGEQRAEQLREAVGALELGIEDGGGPPVTLSMGVAVFPDHGRTGDDVVRAADAAMYRAKERGRDAVVAASA